MPSPSDSSPKGGFALIITLSLMAVALLIVVSLSALTQVGSRTLNTALEEVKARQNAMFALQVALGQLQKHAGPDQAVTAPATTVYPEKNELLYDNGSLYKSEAATAQSQTFLNEGRTWLTPNEREAFDQSVSNWWNQGQRQPYWTAVFAGHLRRDRGISGIPEVRYEDDADGTRYGEPRRMRNQVPGQPSYQLPVWLVSGNESIAFDPATATDYPSGYFTPDAGTLPEPIPGGTSVYIVDANAAPTNQPDDPAIEGLDGRIIVPKVELPGATSTRQEHYAYWVGDESTKFNLAVEDPYRDETDESSVEYRNRLQTPLYGGWRGLTPFPALLSDGQISDLLDAQAQFLQLTDFSQGALLDDDLQGTPGDFKDAAPRQLFHSATVNSKSLLTDPVLGGLKLDLTRYLISGTGLNGTRSIIDPDRYESADPRFNVYDPQPFNTKQFPASTENLPVWGDLRDWFNNEAGEDQTGSIQPSTEFAPILTMMRFHTGFSYVPGTKRLRFHWYPVIALWNPYDTPLKLASYEITANHAFEIQDLLLVTQTSDTPNPTTTSGDGVAFVTSEDPKNTPAADPAQPPPTPNAYAYALKEISGGPSIGRNAPQHNPKRNPPDEGPLKGESILHSIRPFGGRVSPTAVEDPLRVAYRVSAEFEPGETLLFAIKPGEEIHLSSPVRSVTGSNPVELVNDFGDEPGHMSFDIAEVENGPPAGDHLRLIGRRSGPLPNFEIPDQPRLDTPFNIQMKVQGSPGTIEIPVLSPDFQLGPWVFSNFVFQDPYIAAGAKGYNTEKFYAGNDIKTYRKIFDHSADYPGFVGNTPLTTTDVPFTHYGTIYLQPLFPTTKTWRFFNIFGLDSYNRNFALFNLRAPLQREHPLEFSRAATQAAVNNADEFGRLSRSVSLNDSDEPWAPSGDDAIYDEGRGFGILGFRKEAGNTEGLTSLAIYNARRADSRTLSVGQFNSTNLSRFFWQPGFAVGNSEATPYVDRAGITGLTGYKVRTNTGGLGSFGNYSPTEQSWPNTDQPVVKSGFVTGQEPEKNHSLDLSYLLNENLWDRYFLSSIDSSGSLNPYDPADFDNPRLRPVRTDGSLTVDDLRDFETASAHIGIAGALNVNSTSVEAWKALLTSFRDLKIRSIENDENPDGTVPVSRTLIPINKRVDFTFNGSGFDGDETTFGATGGPRNYLRILSGYRYLTDSMIDALAKRIVDEVRLRGPFYSLADFVNRRLVAPSGANVTGSAWTEARTENPSAPSNVGTMPTTYDPVPGMTGITGALQRAINLSGINGGVNDPRATGQPGSVQDEDDRAYDLVWPSSSENVLREWASKDAVSSPDDQRFSIPAGARYHLDMEHMAGAPASEAGHHLSHTPGFVTQGALLGMIGSALTARGDTFRIRAYGESSNPLTGTEHRAYLEAIVQRTPDPVAAAEPTADLDDPDRWRPTSSLGRQFRIISLRWLPDDEI